MIYLELLLGFLKVGLFSFGGGYAAVPLIRETVLSYGWLDDSRLADLIAVSESTPGPIMVNLATYVGATQGGVLGAVIATVSSILPAFLIVIVFMKLMQKAFKNEHINAALDGVKPAIAGLILATGVYMAVNNMITFMPVISFDIKAVALTSVLAVIYFGSRKVVKKGISPILLIVISAIAGVALYTG